MTTNATLEFTGKKNDALADNNGLAVQQVRRIFRILVNQNDISFLTDAENGNVYPTNIEMSMK